MSRLYMEDYNKKAVDQRKEEQREKYTALYHFQPDKMTDKDRRDMIDSILIKARKIDIQEENLDGLKQDEIENRMRFALTANRNLQEMYNFSLDGPAIKALASKSREEQYAEYMRINKILDDQLGASEISKAKPFYPGFPEEVMKMSEAELYLAQLTYYFGSFILGENDFYKEMKNAGIFAQETQHRPKKLEFFEREHKVLTLAKPGEAHEMMSDMIHGVSMSEEKLKFLSKYGSCFPEEFKEQAAGTFKSKENMVNVAVMLYENGMKDKIKEAGLCKDATDILRFISVYSEKHGARNGKNGHDPVRLCSAKSLEVRLPGKEEKAFVKEMMADCKNLYVDIWTQKDMWKKVMRNIDAVRGPERVVKAFDNLARNKRVDENGRRLQNVDIAFRKAKEALREGEIKPMADFAKNFQGYFLQHALNAVTVAQTVQSPPLDENSSLLDIIYSAKEGGRDMALETADLIRTLDKADPSKLLKLKNAAESRNEQDIRITRNKHGNLMKEEREAVKLEPYVVKAISEAVDARVAENVKDTKEMGMVYLDPALKDIKVPQQQDSKASDGVSYSTGSRLQSNPGKNLICMGIHWYAPGNPHIDLDLHTALYDKDMNFIRDCGFQSHHSEKERASTLFSGDFVTADPCENGTGAVEMILMDKEKLREEGAAYVGTYVHDYSGNMDKLPVARAFYAEKEGTLVPSKEKTLDDYSWDDSKQLPTFGGEVIDPAEFEESIRLLPRKNDDRILIMYDVEKDNYLWIDEPGTIGHGARGLDKSADRGYLAIMHAMNSPEPSMYDVLAAYAEGNGMITDDITQADTVFTAKPVDRAEKGIKEEAELLSAYDSDRIYNEYCVKQEQGFERGPLEKEIDPSEIGGPDKGNKKHRHRDAEELQF